MIIVQKYGGQLLATPEKILLVAEKIKRLHDQGHKVIATVSAMGKTTDELISLAKKVSPSPVRRELDMLLTVGERISMSLLSMALNDLGIKAKSFTGSQTGILTESDHTSAKIIDVRPTRIQKEIEHDCVIIIAGFQGVSEKEKEITTLGRGGSDTTAVALAHALKANRLEIIKEVGGIYSTDPNKIRNARFYKELDYQTAVEATYWGAKILHFRAVSLAQRLNIPIYIQHFENPEISTYIHGDVKMLETHKVLAVSVLDQVVKVQFKHSLNHVMNELSDVFKNHSAPWPQLLGSEDFNGKSLIYFTSSDESLKFAMGLIKNMPSFEKTEEYSVVTATCFGSVSSEMSAQLSRKLSENGVKFYKIFSTPQSLGFLVDIREKETAQSILHSFV